MAKSPIFKIILAHYEDRELIETFVTSPMIFKSQLQAMEVVTRLMLSATHTGAALKSSDYSLDIPLPSIMGGYGSHTALVVVEIKEVEDPNTIIDGEVLWERIEDDQKLITN